MILCMQEDVNSIMLHNNLTTMGIVSGIPFLAILRIFQSIVQSATQRCCPIQLGIRDMIWCIGYKIFDGPILVSAGI